MRTLHLCSWSCVCVYASFGGANVGRLGGGLGGLVLACFTFSLAISKAKVTLNSEAWFFWSFCTPRTPPPCVCAVAKSIYLLWPVFLFSVVVFYANSWECDGFAELDVLTNTIRRGKTFSKSSPSWRTNKCCAQPTSLWKKREPANTQLVFCVASK